MAFENRIKRYFPALPPTTQTQGEKDIYCKAERDRSLPPSLQIITEQEKIYDLFYDLLQDLPNEVLAMRAVSFHKNRKRGNQFILPGKEKMILLSLLDDHREIITRDPDMLAAIGCEKKWVTLDTNKSIHLFSEVGFKKEFELLRERNIHLRRKIVLPEIRYPENYNVKEYQEKFRAMVNNLGLFEIE